MGALLCHSQYITSGKRVVLGESVCCTCSSRLASTGTAHADICMDFVFSLCEALSIIDTTPNQEALLRKVSVENSHSREMRLNVTGDFYTEKEMREDLKLSPSLLQNYCMLNKSCISRQDHMCRNSPIPGSGSQKSRPSASKTRSSSGTLAAASK